ncbi:MAG: hypothetical protein ABSH38_22410 [Verrucomicrobiota bacterium]
MNKYQHPRTDAFLFCFHIPLFAVDIPGPRVVQLMQDHLPMKKCFVLFALSACCILNAAETPTNLLSISLVDNKEYLSRTCVNPPETNEVMIISPPVLADRDFAAFDTTNQTFAITPEAAKRLASAIWVLGKKYSPGWEAVPYRHFPGGEYDLIPTPVPFVLQVSGETIYSGIITKMTSSDGFSGPAILADQNFITTNLAHNVTFTIYRGYPPPNGFATGGGVDRRGDKRIVAAVQKLFAHENK